MSLTKKQRLYLPFKRILDICFALIFFILISPYFLIILFLNIFFAKGKPFLLQERVGRNNKSFSIIKFRTLVNDYDENLPSSQSNLKDEDYLPLGKFLRATSSDELPQLINVIFGSMSLIGPRPLIDKDEDHKTILLREENSANKVRPGLTGLAQINGRVNLCPQDKAYYDGEYVKKISFSYDIDIFFATIKKVIKQEDIIK